MSDSPSPSAPEEKSSSVRFSHKISYLAFLGFEGVLRLFPLNFWCLFGQSIGFLGWLLLPRYRRRIRRNLAIIFGETKTPEELNTLTRQNFQTSLCNFIAAAKASTMTDAALNKHFTIEGKEHILQATEKGRGVICAISHSGNWELLARIRPHFKEVCRFGSLYRELDNPLIEEHWKRRRERSHCEMFGKKTSTFAQSTEILRDNGMLGILCDQNAGNYGVLVPYFGKLTSTTNLPALLHRRTKAAISLVTVRTERLGHWVVTFSPLLDWDSKQKNTTELTALINHQLSEAGKLSPSDGFWLHNRWKQDCLLPQGAPAPVPEHDYARFTRPLRLLLVPPSSLEEAPLLLPIMRAFSLARPDAEWSLVCPEEQEAFWQLQPEVSHLFSFKDASSLRPALTKANTCSPYFLDVALLLDDNEDTAPHLHSLGDIVLCALESRPFKKKIRRLFKRKKTASLEHQLETYLPLLDNFSIPLTSEAFSPRKERQKDTLELLALAPFSSLGDKAECPESFWTDFFNSLSPALKATSFTLIAEEKDRQKAEDFAQKQGVSLRVGSLKEIKQTLLSSQALLSVDGLLPQLSSCLGVPCYTLMGPRLPEQFRPLGTYHAFSHIHEDCAPCPYKHCPRPEPCLSRLSGARVARAFQNWLSELNDKD